MCKAFEELAEKRAAKQILEEKEEAAMRMLAMGKFSTEDIAISLELPIEIVEELARL